MPLFSFLNFSNQVNMSSVTNDIAQNISENCGSNNTAVNSASGVKLDITNSTCANITGVSQTMHVDQTCVENETSSVVASTFAKLANKAEQNGMGAFAGPLFSGFKVDNEMSENDISTHISNKMQEQCGNLNIHVNYTTSVSMDLSGVSCQNLTVVTQTLDDTSRCHLNLAAATLDQNKTLMSNLNQENGPDFLAYILVGGVICVILAIIAMIAREHARQNRANLRMRRVMAVNPNALSHGAVEQQRAMYHAKRAAAMGHPVPAIPRPTRSISAAPPQTPSFAPVPLATAPAPLATAPPAYIPAHAPTYMTGPTAPTLQTPLSYTTPGQSAARSYASVSERLSTIRKQAKKLTQS